MSKQLETARQRITELCATINTLHRLRGGVKDKVRVEDYLEGLELPRPLGEILGATENVGSTTRDYRAPRLGPPMTD